jgi:hypothetical protein
VIALDPGSSCLKLLLAEMELSGPRVLECRAIDLREEAISKTISGHLQVLRELNPARPGFASTSAICQLTELSQSTAHVRRH